MFYDMEYIARLLNVGFIRFVDVIEGEFFRKWMNDLIKKYGDEWVKKHRDEIIMKFKRAQEAREQLFKQEKKRRKNDRQTKADKIKGY